MGYQFLHLEGYGRVGGSVKKKSKISKKWSAMQIINEAERIPGYCPHVENPEPAIIIFGISPSQALAEAEFAATTTVDSRGHALRKDAPILLAGVFSAPPDFTDAEWSRLRRDSIDFLRKQFGERLRSVVQHMDETSPHAHYYVVPLPGQRALELHPGHSRKHAVGNRKDVKSNVQNAAYKTGMQTFQDDYQNTVGVWSGLARVGPKRRRLDRSTWLAEKNSNTANRKAFELASLVTEIFRKETLQTVQALPPTISSCDPNRSGLGTTLFDLNRIADETSRPTRSSALCNLMANKKRP